MAGRIRKRDEAGLTKNEKTESPDRREELAVEDHLSEVRLQRVVGLFGYDFRVGKNGEGTENGVSINIGANFRSGDHTS